MKRKKTGQLFWYALCAVLLLLDQISKCWVEKKLKPMGELAVLPGFFGLQYAENTGAAFSAFVGSNTMLSIVSAVVCGIVLIVLLRQKSENALLSFGLTAVLAGGLGNLIDRIVRGYVIDFFEIQFMRFAVFNIADICVTVGAGAVILAIVLHRGNKDERVDG